MDPSGVSVNEDRRVTGALDIHAIQRCDRRQTTNERTPGRRKRKDKMTKWSTRMRFVTRVTDISRGSKTEFGRVARRSKSSSRCVLSDETARSAHAERRESPATKCIHDLHEVRSIPTTAITSNMLPTRLSLCAKTL
jgi:hypothetical protein